jgi:ATP-dependent protease ClpP protease subunit
MARLQTHQLAYRFEVLIRRALRGRKNIDPIIKTLAEDLIEEVPAEAYEAKSPADAGYLIWNGATSRTRCEEMQHELLSAHLSLKPGTPIHILMTNPGGSFEAGMAVIATIYRIRRQKRIVNITVTGEACSMGGVILQAADHRAAEDGTILMLHDIHYGGVHARSDFHVDEKEGVDIASSAIFALFEHRTGKPASYWKGRTDRKDLYLSAREALKEGLLDEVLKRP